MEIENYDNPHQAINSVQKFLDNHAALGGEWLLEAGCGSLSILKIPETAKLVGIDISQKQLDRNQLLREKICGDLQTYPIEKEKFKLCICWDVIEHIKDSDAALNNLCKSVKPDGYIILALPNVRSLKGLVTRFSPHGFHVWYYKNILGVKNAGENDTAPFTTYLKLKISAPEIIHYLESHRFQMQKVIYRDAMVHQLKLSHYWLWVLYIAIASTVKIFTGGFYGGTNNSDFILIAKKR